MLLPSTLAALGLIPDDEAEPEACRGEGVLPVTAAAIQAVNTPGTELDGTEVGGSPRGVRGLWVELRHRRRHPQATEAPTARGRDRANTDDRRLRGHATDAEQPRPRLQ